MEVLLSVSCGGHMLTLRDAEREADASKCSGRDGRSICTFEPVSA